MDIAALPRLPTATDSAPDAVPPRQGDAPAFTAVLHAAEGAGDLAAVEGLVRLRTARLPKLPETPADSGTPWIIDAHALAPPAVDAHGTETAAVEQGGEGKGGPRDDHAKKPLQTAAAGMPTPPTLLAAPVAGTIIPADTGVPAPDGTPAAAPLAGNLRRTANPLRTADDGPASPPTGPATTIRDAATTATGTPLTGAANASPVHTPPAALPGVDAVAAPQAATSLPGSPSVAHATAPAAGTPTPPPTTLLQAPVGTPAWQQELGQQLIRLGRHGDHQVRLQLHPAELGTLQVHLHFHHDHAQAQFLAAHAQARDAIQQALPQLREAFAQHGIALGEAMVGQQQQHPQERDASGQMAPWAGESGGDIAPTGTETRTPVHPAPLPLRIGGVDLYA